MVFCCCCGRGKKKQKEEEAAPPPEEEDEGPPDYTPWWVKEEQEKEEEESEEEGYQSAGELEAAEQRKSMHSSASLEAHLPPQEPQEAPLDEPVAEGLARMQEELGDCSAFDEAQWEEALARYPAGGEGRAGLDRALVLCIRARCSLALLTADHSSSARNAKLTDDACKMLRTAVDAQAASILAEEYMKAGISCMGTDDEASDSVLLETLLRSTLWFQLVLQAQPRNHTALEHWVQRVKDLREEFPYVDLEPLHTPPTGYCLLHCAAMQSNTAIVTEGLAHGCNVNTRAEESGETALHMVAAAQPDLDLAKELLRAGANMDLQERQGKTALFLACENGNTDLVQLLLDSKASPEVEANGKSCLEAAKAEGSENIVALITRSCQKEEKVDEEVLKERKRAAAAKKKKERTETFQQHNPMEREGAREEGEASADGADESEADYDESGDEESGSGWSDIGESSAKAEEESVTIVIEAEASETTTEAAAAEDEEMERARMEAERKREEQRKIADSVIAAPTAEQARALEQAHVDYKSTDLYKEFSHFKQRLSTNP